MHFKWVRFCKRGRNTVTTTHYMGFNAKTQRASRQVYNNIKYTWQHARAKNIFLKHISRYAEKNDPLKYFINCIIFYIIVALAL